MKRSDLLGALEIVKPGLATKSIIEQSTSFAFIDGYVVTYNDEISIRHPVKDLSISGAIEAEQLYKLLDKLTQDDIEVQSEGSEVLLKSGRAKAGFILQSEIKLPLTEINKHTEWRLLPEGFCKALDFTMTTCSRDSSRPIYTCVFANSNGILISTDNFRVSLYRLEALPVKSFLLPATSAQIVAGHDLVKISEGKGWIHFLTKQGTEFNCRVYAGNYPDLSKLLEVDGVKIELPTTIQDVLDRASVFCTEELALDQKVIVTISERRLKLRAEGNTGWFEEETNMGYRGNPLSFIINPHLLKTILGQTRHCIAGESSLKFVGDKWQHIVSLMD